MAHHQPELPAGVRVTLRDLRFAYPDGQQALCGVDLDIEAGEMLGLLGGNGAGKSTLLLHLNGILRGQGTLRIGDRQVTDKTLPQIRARVGLVFQNPDDQLFLSSVYDDVAFGPRNQGLSAAEVAERTERALSIVGMSDAASRPPHHLSVGQKKRVALATVLSMDCEVLVLDEPTSGLDPKGRKELAQFLRTLPQTRIVATHDLEFAVELCDRVAILHEGRILAIGSPAEIMSDAELMDSAGLEVPHSLRYHAAGIPHAHVAPAEG